MPLATLTLRASQLWPVSAAAVAAVAVALALLYWPQVRLLSRPWYWLLPGLRGLAIATLALSVLRPVINRSKTVEEQGAVVVLMDRSMSMGVRDYAMDGAPSQRRRVLGPLLAIAGELGRLPPAQLGPARVSEDLKRLEALADDIGRARREVEYAQLSGRQMHQAQGRLEEAIGDFLAAARQAEKAARANGSRPAVIEHLSRLARTPRAERREQWIGDLRGMIAQARTPAEESQALIDEQAYQSSEQVRRACDQLSRLSRLELCLEMAAGGERSLLGRLDPRTPVLGFSVGEDLVPIGLRFGEAVAVEADAAASDLSGGVRRAMARLADRPIQAVVLFSDGRQVGGNPSIPAGLLPSGVPIFAVHAAAGQVRDLAIEQVELPRAVYVDEPLVVRVTARALGIPERLSGQAAAWVQGAEAASAPLRGREGRLEASLKLNFDKPGLHRIIVSLPVQPGEATVANNQVERWVKVVAQKTKVLLVSGSAGWDYRYLRNALRRSTFVELRDALVVPGYSGLAMLRHDVLQQDLVILNDLARECLSLEQWDALRELVSRRGGSVICIAGMGHLQQEYAGHALGELLPYPSNLRPSWRIWPGETAYYHLAPAEGMEDLAASWLDDDVDVGRRRWDELPGFYRYLSIPELKANARVLLLERESRSPLLTESRVGTGRVFFLGMSETWRWRQRVGERDQDRFWLKLARYAAEEPYAAVSGPLHVDVDRAVAEVGESIGVRAKVITARGEWPPTAVDLAVWRGGQTVALVTLEPAGNASDGRYAAVLSDLPPGDYELRASVPSGDQAGHELVLPIRVQKSGEQELRNIAGDRDLLVRLAEGSGGKCVNLDQVGMLPGMLAEAVLRQPRMSELHLWDSHYLFLFVLGCLSLEWALRKRLGLA